jgi:hypothetical protein
VTRPEDTEVTDPGLRNAVGLLKALPEEAPPLSMAALVVAQVRPVARRRRRLLLGVVAVALVSAVAWAVVFFSVLSQGEGL